MDIGDIRDSFAFFDSWEDKYRFVIEIGRDLPPLDAALKTEDNLVRGCQSQVWLVAAYDPVADRLTFAIDSDAHIVRGLIAIILAAFDKRSPAEILAFDVEALFEELELLQHLSPSRGNGLRAMVGRIRGIAAENAAGA
ncbi:MAG TPA: SufE family protein [Pseudomonadales bacterium]|jgi:cysteine desulfuration protein SufE